MASILTKTFQASKISFPSKTRTLATAAAAAVKPSKPEGDISSVFVSLSGTVPPPLPSRFIAQKRRLIAGHADQVKASWDQLLDRLATDLKLVQEKGSDIIPQIEFQDLGKADGEFVKEIRERGVGVIKGVVSESEALKYLADVKEYIRANPSTKAFPAHDPQVFELYWSKPQLLARAHPNMLAAQRFLMEKTWHCTPSISSSFSTPNPKIFHSHPLSYADRLRIRQPHDASFSLGPHIDGGSLERWEDTGYGPSQIPSQTSSTISTTTTSSTSNPTTSPTQQHISPYAPIFHGTWPAYDPFNSASRVPVISDLYSGAGSCSMFRMYQGWLSLSHTSPGEGTLLVNPLLRAATAYVLLRPFFTAQKQQAECASRDEYLDKRNWTLEPEISPKIEGAAMGCGQEVLEELHPHLFGGPGEKGAMVSVPSIGPGDYVVWHCDTIHAVDPYHAGETPSSVFYIPVCPLTEGNAEYLRRQRDTLVEGTPGPDFPGGVGEKGHVGRGSVEWLREVGVKGEGLASLGLEKLEGEEEEVLKEGNGILGFE